MGDSNYFQLFNWIMTISVVRRRRTPPRHMIFSPYFYLGIKQREIENFVAKTYKIIFWKVAPKSLNVSGWRPRPNDDSQIDVVDR